MKRQANPQPSSSGELALAQYGQTLREQQDLAPASRRNYLSDVRHFMRWYEAQVAEHAADGQDESGFDPQAITIPTLTRYRQYLQTVQRQKPASVNRALGYLVKKYAHAAKLPDVSPHDLRHRFGYRMAESVPLPRLAQILGHDSLDTTRLYIQGTRHNLQQAVETIAWT